MEKIQLLLVVLQQQLVKNPIKLKENLVKDFTPVLSKSTDNCYKIGFVMSTNK